MANENQALALLQAAIALAGLVLIYAGFLSAKSTEAQGNRSGDKFRTLAAAAMVPVVLSLLCALVALEVITPASNWQVLASKALIPLFRGVVICTAIYAIIAAFLSS